VYRLILPQARSNLREQDALSPERRINLAPKMKQKADLEKEEDYSDDRRRIAEGGECDHDKS
jgi:hypothetical protein